MVAKPASIERGSKVDMIFLSQVISTIQKTIHALPRVNCVKKCQNNQKYIKLPQCSQKFRGVVQKVQSFCQFTNTSGIFLPGN